MRKRLMSIKQNDENSIIRLTVASMAFTVVTNTVNCITNVFLPNTPIDTVICYLIYLFILVMALPTILQRLSIKSMYALFIVAILYIVAFINPYSSYYAQSIMVRTIQEAFPYFILGQAIKDDRKLKDSLTRIAPFVISMAVVYYIVIIFSGSEVREDYMTFSYRLLPFSAILLLNTMRKPSLKGIAFLFFSISIHLLTGTRGPLVCLVFCFAFGVFFSNMSNKMRLLLLVMGASFVIYLFSPLFVSSIEALNGVFMNFGIRNRILMKIIREDFFGGSGRENVQAVVLQAISEKPIFGYGFLGDRSFQNGGYPHNFVLEIWCHFGVLLGSIIILLLIHNYIKMFKNRKENRILYIMLFSVSYVKLMLSGTYPIEGMLFFLLGLSMNSALNQENEKSPKNTVIGIE